ncbi:MAG TPA: outer membrane beta-barrel protein [Thermoanaerobaculia bacterium]|nr:outer membrane beta-barrel protein [Thermoanaerobaculia bacterium]
MTQHLRRLGTGIILLAAFLLPGAARAQEPYTFTVGLLGGIGGSLDADPGDDLGNTGYQVNLDMVTEPRTHVGFRLGNLALDGEERFGTLTDAELSYITVAGEYRFPESYYESGIYAGLGGYRLEGTRGGRDRSETAPGLVVGVTGEFRVTRWLAVLIELSGHYADFDEAQFFAIGHGGVAVHF